MKVFAAAEIQKLDALTIAEENIDSAALMERAALVFSNWLQKKFPASTQFYFFCGTGNNGGDGLCAARHLFLKGYAVTIYLIGDSEKASKDHLINLNRAVKFNLLLKKYPHDAFPQISKTDIIVDAIFGSGLNRPPEGHFKELIQKINNSDCTKISIDVPSGFFCDEPTLSTCIKADHTFSFEFPKQGFFFPENNVYTGEWHIASIGLSNKGMAEITEAAQYIRSEDIQRILRPRQKFGHKGSYGHSLIFAGSPGMEGAAALSAKACLVTGSGLVTICSSTQQSFYPELMYLHDEDLHGTKTLEKYTASGAGPGLGTDESTVQKLKHFITELRNPLVLDADALNIISQHPALLDQLHPLSILTPHPKEFERLFGKTENSFDQLRKQKLMSAQYNCIIILKRAFTCITTPNGDCYFNSTGNPGMATGGSGDVLAGMVTAFIAQKYTPLESALAAVYLHGLAGDLALHNNGGQNIIASDILDFIQPAIDHVVFS